jgi:hypothetical protein
MSNSVVFNINENHSRYFKDHAQIGAWRERYVAPWLHSIKSANIAALGTIVNDKPLTRDLLKEFAITPSVTDRDVLWAILAWGGMRRDAAGRLASNEHLWTKIVGRLRRDSLDRRSSYEICSAAVNSVREGGIGPAYFTKLIFFANPKHDGYIMDQWTSRSINFIIDGPPVVRMKARDYVSPRNDVNDYERFCQAIEQLAGSDEGRGAEFIEQCLFSTGGRTPAPWRRYLLKQGG